jgi:N-carbamoylputrescine amidase
MDIGGPSRNNSPMRLRLALFFAACVFVPAAPRTLRVAVCQILGIDGDREGNFRRIEYALDQARTGGAQIAAFPESMILGWENPDAHKLATPIPGADSDRIASLARKYGMMILIGLDEKDGDRLYDSAILVDKTGKILWKHRKLNVLAFLMDPPYSQGKPEGIGVADTEFGRIGVLICADTFLDRAAYQMTAFKPDLVIVPYGWAAESGQWPAHARNLERLVQRRGAEWKCPVVAPDLVGAMSHGPWKGQTYGGASLVVDGSGRVLHRLRDRDVEVKVVDISLGK